MKTLESYKRLPRVRNLQYFTAYLMGLEEGGIEEAEKFVFEAKLKFERDKAEAMGRGKKIEKVKSKYLSQECQKMGEHLDLLKREDHNLVLNKEDKDIKILLEGDSKKRSYRHILLKRFLLTYEPFNHLLFQARECENGKIYATLDRGESIFRKSVKPYKIGISQWNFEIARDLGSQLGVLNWRALNEEEMKLYPDLGKKGMVVYLVTNVIKLSELQKIREGVNSFYQSCIRNCAEELGIDPNSPLATKEILERAHAKNYLITPFQDDWILIKELAPDTSSFERVLWNEYIAIAYDAGTPVYYTELRDAVCEKLRISDMTFDDFIAKMINNPSRYNLNVFPGEGVLPLSVSDKRKNLPPRVRYGIFAVYLVIYKRRRT